MEKLTEFLKQDKSWKKFLLLENTYQADVSGGLCKPGNVAKFFPGDTKMIKAGEQLCALENHPVWDRTFNFIKSACVAPSRQKEAGKCLKDAMEVFHHEKASSLKKIIANKVKKGPNPKLGKATHEEFLNGQYGKLHSAMLNPAELKDFGNNPTADFMTRVGIVGREIALSGASSLMDIKLDPQGLPLGGKTSTKFSDTPKTQTVWVMNIIDRYVQDDETKRKLQSIAWSLNRGTRKASSEGLKGPMGHKRKVSSRFRPSNSGISRLRTGGLYVQSSKCAANKKIISCKINKMAKSNRALCNFAAVLHSIHLGRKRFKLAKKSSYVNKIMASGVFNHQRLKRDEAELFAAFMIYHSGGKIALQQAKHVADAYAKSDSSQSGKVSVNERHVSSILFANKVWKADESALPALVGI